MKKIYFILFTLFNIFIWSAQSGNPWEPEPKSKKSWRKLHRSFVANTKENATNIKIVFTGSSSIKYWSTTGGDIWNAKYVPLGAVNYGIGGDKIQNCLWRIMNGELDNLNPKLLVLYCGSNNVPTYEVDDIVRGIKTTLDEIAKRLPQTKILYVTFNPRGDRSPVNETFEKIKAVNNKVIPLGDGNTTTVFDMFDQLIESWGEIKTDLYQSDELHLNKEGYQVWDASWNSTFYRLWNDKM